MTRDTLRRKSTLRAPRVDPQEMARYLAVRSEMADLREDLLAARYRTESALVVLEQDAAAAERHLAEAQRAMEKAAKRTRMPEEVFYRRLPRWAAAKIFEDGGGEA